MRRASPSPLSMWLLSMWLLGMLLLGGGCQSTEPPGLRYGPHVDPREQRVQAQQFDPYPQTQRSPEIEGGRPPGYENPIPEIQRDQRNRFPAGY